MSTQYTDPRFGSLVERYHNFAPYLIGTAQWNGQIVSIWVMGGADAKCVVRPASLDALGVLFDSQRTWTQRIRGEIVTKLYLELKDRLRKPSLDADSFWDGLRLLHVRTDDDFTFEFVFDTSGVGLTNTICVYGQPDIGVEEAFVDPNTPNPDT
ncbi:MAG: hypothetical protein AAF249_11830 [Pseudomonadota bacterium]